MAEKYGTVPKKFTSEWWEYFWMYYKVYVIVAVFIIIAAAVTINQIMTAPKYDLTVTYAGNSGFPEEISDEVISSITPMCKDVDGNKEKSINFTQINLGTKDDMYNAQMEQKLVLSISEQDVYIYILEKNVIDALVLSKSNDEIGFDPVNKWFDGDLSEMSKYEKDGTVFGVELTDCKVFQKIADKTGADFSGNYLLVRSLRKDKAEKQSDVHKAAMELAGKIVKG